MSLPYCLTNPKLRHVETSRGIMTVRREADGKQTLLSKGENLGQVWKDGKTWKAASGFTVVDETSRREAIEALFLINDLA